MEFRLNSETLSKVALVGGLASTLLSGCGIRNNDTTVEPHMREPAPTLSQEHLEVLSDEYNKGVRVVTFKPGGPWVLTQVVQFCHGKDRVGQVKYVRVNEDGSYSGEGRLRIHPDDPACSDRRITPADGLPIPTPPPPPSLTPETIPHFST